MGYAILKDASSIREKIRELFTVRTRSRRRVILGPLAGLASFDLLPDVRNVELYSWGQEAHPDAVALAGLTARGVRIHWVDPMNLRLYWAKGKGAVICPGCRSGGLLNETDREAEGDLALYFDDTALPVVDAVLGPLLLEPAGNDSLADLQESCALLWRLAEGITLVEPPIPSVAPANPVAAVNEPEFLSQGEGLGVVQNRRLARAGLPDTWYHFLEGECWEAEGLLCFYDRPRSRRVEHLCRFYAAWLGGMENETVGPESTPKRSVSKKRNRGKGEEPSPSPSL